MKLRNIYKTIIILISVFIITSCENGFDTINTDPNNVVDVEPEYLLPGSIKVMADYMNSNYEMLSSADNWVQHVALYNDWMPMQRFELDKFRLGVFNNMYSGPLMDLKDMMKKAAAEGDDGLYGVGLTLYAFGYQMVTDIFGDIPYSEALMLTDGVNKPKYDTQESIYNALLDTLTKANELLKVSDDLIIANGYDPMYDGKVDNWRKFANSLKIRMLMRMSAKADVGNLLTEMVSNPEEYPIFENTEESAFYKYSGSGSGNDYPLASVFENISPTSGVRVSKTLVDYMVSTDDPRLPKIAEENKDGEYVGLSHSWVYSVNEEPFEYSQINNGLGPRDKRVELFEYSELMFLLAEANLKGYIGGNAEDYYTAGIRGSCGKFGVDQASVNAFLAGGGAYDGTLSQTYHQKWVALFMQGYEAWAEYRRTQTPSLSLPINAVYDVVPYRFYYPDEEDDLNKANKDEAAARLSNGDKLDSKIWWME